MSSLGQSLGGVGDSERMAPNLDAHSSLDYRFSRSDVLIAVVKPRFERKP